jgi:hypothetical protein
MPRNAATPATGRSAQIRRERWKGWVAEEDPATMCRAVTDRLPGTTRRPPAPSSASSERGNIGGHGPRPVRSPRSWSPAQRAAPRRSGSGARRWVTRWAKPCRIGRIRPNVAHSRLRLLVWFCRHFVAWMPHERHASHARGRWFETSRAHPRSWRLAGISTRSTRPAWPWRASARPAFRARSSAPK